MATILIVDDEPLSRVSMKSIIKQGFPEVDAVYEAETSDQAIELFEKYLPDGVIMDIRLPDANGIEVADIIIKMHPFARILICSAYDSFSLVSEAWGAGVKGYMLKPVKRSEAIEKIRILLERDKSLIRQLADRQLISIMLDGTLDESLLEAAQREYGPMRSGLLTIIKGCDPESVRSFFDNMGKTIKARLSITGKKDIYDVAFFSSERRTDYAEYTDLIETFRSNNPGSVIEMSNVDNGEWNKRFKEMVLRQDGGYRPENNTLNVQERLLKYLSEGLEDEALRNVSLDSIAFELGITSQHLSHIFKDTTGSNYIDYITERRLEYACRLLEKGGCSVRVVSEKCGYSDSAYFKKLFYKKYGCLPKDYPLRNTR